MSNFSESYLIYLRKSRKDMEAEARGEGETLARHEHALLELARRQHLNVTEIYREVVSGETIAARPVMQRVLSEVEQGLWAGVLVMEVERLARGDTIDQGIISQTFKYSDTKIITPLKTYDPNDEYDEEYFEFGLFMSRREYKTINRRLQRGRLASAKEGKWVCVQAPYGYERQKLKGEKGWTLVPNEEQAEVVRLIFELYTSGLRLPDGSVERMSVGKIARYLNDRGLRSSYGNRWNGTSLRDLLENPVYIGKVRWGSSVEKRRVVDGRIVKQRVPAPPGEGVFDGRHVPIVDAGVFNTAQEYIARSFHPRARVKYEVKNPLAGIVVCADCGRKMVRLLPNNHKPPGVIRCPNPECKNATARLDIVEARIVDGLRGWLSGYELDWSSVSGRSAASDVEQKRKSLDRARADLAKLGAQLDRTHDLLEQGVYDTDTFLNRSRVLAGKIKDAKAQISSLSEELADSVDREARQREIIPKVRNLLAVYASLTDAEAKNILLKEVVEKVVYHRDCAAGKRLKPDEFDIVIFPKLPPANDRQMAGK